MPQESFRPEFPFRKQIHPIVLTYPHKRKIIGLVGFQCRSSGGISDIEHHIAQIIESEVFFYGVGPGNEVSRLVRYHLKVYHIFPNETILPAEGRIYPCFGNVYQGCVGLGWLLIGLESDGVQPCRFPGVL